MSPPWLLGLLARAFAVRAFGSRLGCYEFWLAPWLLGRLLGLLARALAVRASGSRLGCEGFWLVPWLCGLAPGLLARLLPRALGFMASGFAGKGIWRALV